MNERYVTHIVLKQYRSSLSYSERETAAASHLGIGALRHLRAVGLIEGEETGGERRHCEEKGTKLGPNRRLQPNPGSNPEGVGRISPLPNPSRPPPNTFSPAKHTKTPAS